MSEQISMRGPPGTLAAEQIDRTLAANGGRLAPTNEEVHAMLAARGIHPPKAGSTTATYTQTERAPEAYSSVNVDGLPLPEGVDAAALTDGARALGYALQLDPILASAVAKDIAHAGVVDPTAVQALVERCGHKYDELIDLAETALNRGGLRLGREVPIRAKALPAHSLIQIAVLERVKARREGR